MMRKSKGLIGVGVLFVIAASFILLSYGQAISEDAKIVMIKPAEEGKALWIQPPILYINKGTIVVWMNGVVDKELAVIFEEGKACQDVTIYPHGFNLDAKSCYVTSYVPYAETSSLQFPEPGTFKYIVQTEDMKLKATGKIVVRK